MQLERIPSVGGGGFRGGQWPEPAEGRNPDGEDRDGNGAGEGGAFSALFSGGFSVSAWACASCASCAALWTANSWTLTPRSTCAPVAAGFFQNFLRMQASLWHYGSPSLPPKSSWISTQIFLQSLCVRSIHSINPVHRIFIQFLHQAF